MNLNSSLEISSQLSSIKKSNTSLADALREIELAKQSFEKVAFLENTLNYHQLTLDDLKSQASRFVTTGFFNSKWDSLINILDQIVKTKFEEFTNQFHNSLNQKLNIAQADVMLKQKVNCMDFTALSQQMTVLKTQVDKHIYTDFESMKTKFKMTLAQLTNVNPSQIFSEVTKDDLEKINRKIEILEKSIKNTNYEEEGLDEDIDSQAELDSMIDGLERAILDEYKGSTWSEANIEESQIPFSYRAVSLESTRGLLGEGVSPRYSQKSQRSSIGTRKMNGTLVQQIGKKFGILQREVDISKSKLLEITQKADLCDENITETENLINKIRDKQLEMHAKAELMEKNLIKVLNNPIGVQIDKDIDKITKENNKYIESLKAALETKNTNVTEIQAFLEKVVIDLNQVKSSHREKINEIVKCVHDIKNEGVTTKEEINKILDSIKNNEDKLRLDIDNLNSEMTEIKGPIIDIIKTQHHENESLTNEIGRQLETNRNLVGKIALNIDSLSALTPLNSNLHSPSRESTHQVLEFFKPTSRMQSTSPIRVQSASPSMSAKNRSYRGNSAFKISASPVKLDDNWLSLFPDGVQMQLPRVPRPKSSGTPSPVKEKPGAKKLVIKPKLNSTIL